jgi:hypothetical protein
MPKREPDWGRFLPADYETRLRLIGASSGPEGTGKSHFWLTAPEPVAVQLFDPGGLEGLLPQFKGKDIRVLEYRFNPGTIDRADRGKVASELLEHFIEDYDTALKVARTIVWDKEDYVWELFRYDEFDAFTDRPANYYELYMRYRAEIQKASDAGVCLGLIRGLKEKWGKTGTNRKTGDSILGFTGEIEQRGMKEIPELVQVNLEHWWEGGEFHTRIGKCKQNTALRGQEFINLSFSELAQLTFPDSTEDSWL